MADCIFCKIASGEIPAKLVRRSDEALAFHDLTPQAPVHVLVIPTKHYAAARDATGPEGQEMLGKLMVFATQVATDLGLDAGGYRLVTNTGADGGQSVFHHAPASAGGAAHGMAAGVSQLAIADCHPTVGEPTGSPIGSDQQSAISNWQ